MILYNFFYGMYFPPIDPDRIHYLRDYFEYLLYLTFREPPKDQKLYVHHIVPRSFLPELWRNRARGRWNNVILVTKDDINKQIRPEHPDSYLSQGWTLGRKPRNPRTSV